MADILNDCRQVAKDLRGGSPYQSGLASCLEDAADEIERLTDIAKDVQFLVDRLVTNEGASEFAGQLSDLSDIAIGVVNGLKYDRAVLREAMRDALAALDASLFTNAEHSRAKDILRSHLKEKLGE